MKKHVKIYLDYFGYDVNSFIDCEVCGSKSVDIHHIEPRGMGGNPKGDKDVITNLQALCRPCHVYYGDKKQYKEFLKDKHLIKLATKQSKYKVMREIKGRNGGTLKVPEKGETANPNGRPKKFTTELAEHGYKLSEVNDSIQAIMAMNETEIKEVLKNNDATMLEKTVARAIIKSYEKGSLFSMDTLLSRVFGKPKESVEATVEAKVVNVTLKLD
jgi:hypothetical protein